MGSAAGHMGFIRGQCGVDLWGSQDRGGSYRMSPRLLWIGPYTAGRNGLFSWSMVARNSFWIESKRAASVIFFPSVSVR